MEERAFRSAIAAEAKSWEGTPYHINGALKGAGVNCAQFLYGVALNAGVLPSDAPSPRAFTAQLAAMKKEDRLAAYIAAYGGREIHEAEVKTGDIVFYQVASEHGHTAIVLDWHELPGSPATGPGRWGGNVVHSMPLRGCQMGLVNEGRLGAKARRYFTLWRG